MDLRTEVDLTMDAILEKIAKAEAYYISLEKLDFRKMDAAQSKVKLKKDNTTETFVRKFFDKFNVEYRTHYTESNNIYCINETRRSIGDVFRCAYSYLGSKIKLKDVILETYKRNLDKSICANYCYQINKRVYKERGENKNGQYYDPNYSDELGFKLAHYKILYNHFTQK